MHPSLSELTTEARRASSPAMARGILAEAQELMRNALDHGESETALAFWLSRTLQEWAESPAVEEITGGARLRFTGAVARFEWPSVSGHMLIKLASDLLGSIAQGLS